MLAGRDRLAADARQYGADHLQVGAPVANDVVQRKDQHRPRGVRYEARAPGQAALHRQRVVEQGVVEGFQRLVRVGVHTGLHPKGIGKELVDEVVIGQELQLVSPARGHDAAAQARVGAGELAQSLAHQGHVYRGVQPHHVGLGDAAQIAFAGPEQVLGAVQGDQGAFTQSGLLLVG
jgi:hypothetical protein